MNMMQTFNTEDVLLKLAASLQRDEEFSSHIDFRLKKIMSEFDPDHFGPKLVNHLGNCFLMARDFLSQPTATREAYSQSVVDNIAYCFARHDAGKTMDDPLLWMVEKDKPDLSTLTREEKDERNVKRRQHAFNGPIVLDGVVAEIIAETGMVLKPEHLLEIDLTKRVMSSHHEDLKGLGPLRMSADEQGTLLRTLVVIDTYEGKHKNNKPAHQNIAEMAADPKFDANIVQEFGIHLGIWHPGSTPTLAKPAFS